MPKLEVTFPLRLAEQLVSRRFLGKQRVVGLEVDEVDRRSVAHVRLHDEHMTDALTVSVIDPGDGKTRLAFG
ncbi:hypothetical protein D9M71_504690 [compost metagenome]